MGRRRGKMLGVIRERERDKIDRKTVISRHKHIESVCLGWRARTGERWR